VERRGFSPPNSCDERAARLHASRETLGGLKARRSTNSFAVCAASKKLPYLSPANAGSFQWHVPTPAEAGVYFLEPPTAAELARVAGFRK
jgi:hypothetical protein